MKRWKKMSILCTMAVLLCGLQLGAFAETPVYTEQTANHAIQITAGAVAFDDTLCTVNLTYKIEGAGVTLKDGDQLAMFGYKFKPIEGAAPSAIAYSGTVGDVCAIDQMDAAATGTVTFKMGIGTAAHQVVKGDTLIVKLGSNISGISSAQAFYLSLRDPSEEPPVDPQPATYTITFDAGEGSGTMDPATATEGVAFELPEPTFTAPTGMEFFLWKIGDGDETYPAGTTYEFTADTTVTALWKVIEGEDPILPPGTITTILGDVDDSGEVDDDDWQYILLHLNGFLITEDLDDPSSKAYLAADVDQSGEVDDDDWQYILLDLNGFLECPLLGTTVTK